MVGKLTMGNQTKAVNPAGDIIDGAQLKYSLFIWDRDEPTIDYSCSLLIVLHRGSSSLMQLYSMYFASVSAQLRRQHQGARKI
jgi:hypothetical protein